MDDEISQNLRPICPGPISPGPIRLGPNRPVPIRPGPNRPEPIRSEPIFPGPICPETFKTEARLLLLRSKQSLQPKHRVGAFYVTHYTLIQLIQN